MRPQQGGPTRVGELRPSQLLSTFGVGSVVDLPMISALVSGLDGWPEAYGMEVSEPRLLAAVQHLVSPTVQRLRTPPVAPDADEGNPFDRQLVGVPVLVFPRWLRCSRCRRLAPVDSGLFTLRRDPYRPEQTHYRHSCTGQGRSPHALPVRFLLACPSGHLDDFPWVEYAHAKTGMCGGPQLELLEIGAVGDVAGIEVHCLTCDVARRRMSQAFGQRAEGTLPACRGRHPHLGTYDADCRSPVRTILLGATNLWFAETVRLLSVPAGTSDLLVRVEAAWSVLQGVTSRDILGFARSMPALAGFADVADDELLAAIAAHRGALSGSAAAAADAADVLGPEWAAFRDPARAPSGPDFRIVSSGTPAGFDAKLLPTVQATRLREVAALVGFTRVDTPDEPDPSGASRRVALARRAPTWLPCTENRGEGLVVRLPEDALRAWEADPAVAARLGQLEDGYRRWRLARNRDPATGWPGRRYVLLHSLSHALMREVALECGYGAAGIAERLYADSGDAADAGSAHAGETGTAMAGLLLYTAAPDSEGTLGGLVSLGDPDTLGRLLRQALDGAGLCSADPMCAEHDPVADRSAHGAACHACLFAAETSCERGNRFLDRQVLVDTLAAGGTAYFTEALR